jgi:hypothetical protein
MQEVTKLVAMTEAEMAVIVGGDGLAIVQALIKADGYKK